MTASAPASLDAADLRRRRRSTLWPRKGLILGGILLAVALFVALLAPILAPHDPYSQNLSYRLLPPLWEDGSSPAHPLGTDHLGRDILSRLIYGTRISLLIGLVATSASAIIGTSLGLVAGYFGGRVDLAVSFLLTVRLTVPVVVVAIAVVSLVGNSLPVLVATVGLLSWDRFAVVVRSVTQQVRSQDYITAAKGIGCSTFYILFVEVLGNVLGPTIVVATLELANVVLLEAALSFLGLGVPEPLPSWGLMVAEGRENLLFLPWLSAIPGAALCLLVLAINLVGDGVRDMLAPELR